MTTQLMTEEERPKCIRERDRGKQQYVTVEYDRDYHGGDCGDYGGTGDFIRIPTSAFHNEYSLKRAFRKRTGLRVQNIVHFNMDELVDEDGVGLQVVPAGDEATP